MDRVGPVLELHVQAHPLELLGPNLLAVRPLEHREEHLDQPPDIVSRFEMVLLLPDQLLLLLPGVPLRQLMIFAELRLHVRDELDLQPVHRHPVALGVVGRIRADLDGPLHQRDHHPGVTGFLQGDGVGHDIRRDDIQ